MASKASDSRKPQITRWAELLEQGYQESEAMWKGQLGTMSSHFQRPTRMSYCLLCADSSRANRASCCWSRSYWVFGTAGRGMGYDVPDESTTSAGEG